MQHITQTIKCYTKNQFHSDYCKKVTTSRTTSLPFSLTQLIVTHLIERQGHTDPTIYGANLESSRSLSKLTFLENVHLVRCPIMSSPMNRELRQNCTSEFSSDVHLVGSLSSSLDIYMPVVPDAQAVQAESRNPDQVQILALCLFRNYRVLGKNVYFCLWPFSRLSHSWS